MGLIVGVYPTMRIMKDRRTGIHGKCLTFVMPVVLFFLVNSIAFSQEQKLELLNNGDFSSGLSGWENVSRPMIKNQSFPTDSIKLRDGGVYFDATHGTNYYAAITQTALVNQHFQNFIVSFDWAIYEKEPNWGRVAVSFQFYDANGKMLAHAIAFDTANSQHTLAYSRGDLPIRNFVGLKLWLEEFDEMRHVSFDSETDLTGLDTSEVDYIKVSIVVQIDGDAGALMLVDNASVLGVL